MEFDELEGKRVGLELGLEGKELGKGFGLELGLPKGLGFCPKIWLTF